MKPGHKIISVIIAGSILFLAAVWWENSQAKNETPYIRLGGLSFHTSVESGISEAKNQSKPVFLYFRSETCYWCIRFEGEALSDKRVINLLENKYVLVSVDTFKQKNVALNLNVRSSPYMIFFTKDGEEISRIPGYLPTEDFLVQLDTLQGKSKFNETSR